jgi:acylphosphatase
MEQKGFHCIISGRVQGVFYRASTQKKAHELALTGWVRNLANGNVELMAFGTEEQLRTLHNWLWQGPPAAQVADVTCAEVPWQSFDDFAVR